jgi:hypothetical protein
MWKLKTDDRVGRWRDFRKSLDLLTLDQAIKEVAEFWHDCPYNPYYLDPKDPLTWPDPWQLISENYYCDLAKTLGIVYTICFTRHGQKLNAEIQVYNDPVTKYTYNLAFLAKGKYVLNFRDDEIVNIELLNKNLVLQYRYTEEDLKLKEY